MSSKNEHDLSGFRLSPPSRSWSLATRLTLWYTISAFTLLLVGTSYLYWALARNLDREDDQFLANKVRIVRSVLTSRPGDLAGLRHEAEWAWSSPEAAPIYLRVLDDAGAVVIESPGMGELVPLHAFPPATETDPGNRADVRSPAGRSFRAITVRVPIGPEKRPYVVQAAMDREQDEEILEDYRRHLCYVLGLSLIACAVGGYRIARRGLRPVEDIAAMAQRIRATSLDERIDSRELPAELGTLARTFNGMLDRLQESFQRLGQLSANMAHELRTPVNNLRGEVEVAVGKLRSPEEYRETLGSCLEETTRLARMIEAMLFLARSEDPRSQLQRERVDLKRELAAVAEFFGASAEEAGVHLEISVPDALRTDVDRALLQRAVGNLLANAIQHTPLGGSVRLSAKEASEDMVVEVADTGCGIAAEHLPYLFDRFYRVDRARDSSKGGTGLGLAIVKSIAELHGGRVHLRSEIGQGTTVTLTIPR